MNINKNIAIWRGDNLPPTDFHLWEKADGSIHTKIGDHWQYLISPDDKANLDEVISTVDNLEIEELPSSKSEVLRSYRLKSGDKVYGTTIDIPKEEFLKDVQLGYANATVDSITGTINIGTPSSTETSPQYMIYSMSIADGTYKMVKVDLSLFITEKEYSDGLELNGTKLKVKRDNSSESYLTVSSNGVKVSGLDSKFADINSTTTSLTNALQIQISTLSAHTGNKNNPHSVTKAQIGLGNVDNTADANKKVASATKLTTARSIWGHKFDGTSDINGNIVINNTILTDKPLSSVVDLKLPSGTLWAQNSIVDENGDTMCYQWGDTEGYTANTFEGNKEYKWTDYKYCNGSQTTMNKYCNMSTYGTVDNLTVLENSDDTALQNTSTYTMPTYEQALELMQNTHVYLIKTDGTAVHGTLLSTAGGMITWDQTVGQNEVKQCEFRSRVNDSKLVIPATGGIGEGYAVYSGNAGGCWLANLNTSQPYQAYALYFDNTVCFRTAMTRSFGLPVRGVANTIPVSLPTNGGTLVTEDSLMTCETVSDVEYDDLFPNNDEMATLINDTDAGVSTTSTSDELLNQILS